MPNPHIIVPDETALAEFDVTSSTSVFTFTFTFFDSDDLVVKVNDRRLETSEYEVAGATGYEGGYRGGTVTLDAAVTDSTVIIYRDIPPVRMKDFLEGAGYRATPVNTEIDRLVAREQDMRLRFQRVPTFSSTVNKSLTASDMGCQWTNGAASGAIAYTLPPASVGLHGWFSVVTAFALTVIADGDDQIYMDGDSEAQMAASAIGSIFHLISSDDGVWTVDSVNGTWTLSTP